MCGFVVAAAGDQCAKNSGIIGIEPTVVSAHHHSERYHELGRNINRWLGFLEILNSSKQEGIKSDTIAPDPKVIYADDLLECSKAVIVHDLGSDGANATIDGFVVIDHVGWEIETSTLLILSCFRDFPCSVICLTFRAYTLRCG